MAGMAEEFQEEPDAPEVEAEPALDPEVETTARSFGWVPQEEWRGPQDKWMPAEKFLDYGRNSVPILRKNLDEARRTLETLKRELAEKTEVFQEFVKERATSEERMFQQALEKLKNERREARRSGDHDRADELDDAIEELREKGKPARPAEAAQPADAQRQKAHPDFAPWVEANPWYNTDPVLRGVADGIFYDMRSKGDQRMGRELLDDIAKRVRAEMPHKFGARRGASVVEGDTRGSTERAGTSARRGSFNSLPQDAKDQFARFVTQANSGFKDDDESRKLYAEYYFEQEQ